jgi:SAM-dependent methyltransferase
MMWFDKKDSRALFFDKRCEDFGMQKNGRVLIVEPDVQGCFTEMPFPDETFNLVVFDPPHIKGTEGRIKSVMGRQYGLLFPGWEDVIAGGFSECFRVLKENGVLIFKWCEVEIPLSNVLSLTTQKPLFGNRSGKAMNTHWVTFIK